MLQIQRHSKFMASLIFVLSFLLVSLPVTQALAQAQIESQAPSAEQVMSQAEADAEQDTSVTTYWIGGFCCGIFGWLFALLGKPDVPAARLVGKSADYVTIYSIAYKSKVKSMRTRAACTGWAIGSAISLVINLVVLSQSKETNNSTW